MVSIMSESMDRRLSLLDALNLRLHLLVCAWCALYLKQIKLIRTLTRQKSDCAAGVKDSSLSNQARERIARALEATGSPYSNPED